MTKRIKIGIVVLGFVLFSTRVFCQTQKPAEFLIDTTSVIEIELDTLPLIEPEEKDLPLLSDKAIQEKLLRLQGSIPLKYNNTVKSFINAFVRNNRDYVARVAVKQAYYFPVFEKYLKKYNLPDELKYLSIVESGLRPKAASWASAVGLWQFIPSTGKYFGLRQDGFVDERMEVHKSTEAACVYLKQLYDMFGNWELALASYNVGPGFVRRAIRQSGNKIDFWAIYPFLPRETRSYVPMFVAVVYVMNSLEEHKIEPDMDAVLSPSDTVMVSQPVSLSLLAKQLEVSTETLQDMNPHLKKGFVPAYYKNCVIHIPKDKTDQFLVNRLEIMDSVSRIGSYNRNYYAYEAPKPQAIVTKTTALQEFSTQGRKLIYYIVRNGDVLANIANLHNVSIPAIKAWNGLRGNMLWVGQKLSVWVQENQNLTSKNTNESVITQNTVPQGNPAAPQIKNIVSPQKTEISKTVKTLSPDKNQVEAIKKPASPVKIASTINHNQSVANVSSHTVQSGETLWNIAQKYNTSVENILKINNLPNNKLKIGQVLKVK